MRLPGFVAEASCKGRNGRPLALDTRDAETSNRIIPALPIGGYGQIACVKAICKMSPKDCASAYRICGDAGGTSGGSGPDPWCIATCGGDASCMAAFC